MRKLILAIALAMQVPLAAPAAITIPAPPLMPMISIVGCGGVIYYVSASGNDANCGNSPNFPWATIAKVNGFTFPAASTVSFHGGDTFSGSVVVSEDNFTVNSYGTGRGTISSGAAECVRAVNRAGLTVNNIVCLGGGAAATTDGIHVENNNIGTGHLAGPTITNNTVSGYVGTPGVVFSGGNCIMIRGTGGSGTAGFNNITVNGNNVSGCNNGITTFHDNGTTSNQPFTNVTVNNNIAHDNQGQNRSAIDGIITGFGILIANASNVTVSHNLVHDNGANADNTGGAGPVGIITTNTDSAVVSFNESYNQLSGGNTNKDGEGFDFDTGTTNSILEYNYAHNNLFTEQLTFGAGNTGNTIRFNVYDAVGSNVAGIRLNAQTGNISVYNNTFNIETGGTCFSGSNTTTAATWTFANNICRNSGFLLTGNITNNFAGSVLNLTGNDYFGSGGFQLTLTANGHSAVYGSLAALQADGFEKPGGTPSGTTANPNLNGTFPAATCGGYLPPCPNAFQLSAASPAGKGNGLNLNTLYGYSVGSQDFYGNAITNTTLPIGAAANQ